MTELLERAFTKAFKLPEKEHEGDEIKIRSKIKRGTKECEMHTAFAAPPLRACNPGAEAP